MTLFPHDPNYAVTKNARTILTLVSACIASRKEIIGFSSLLFMNDRQHVSFVRFRLNECQRGALPTNNCF